MKIICAGAQKTGTKSLAKALKILGYNVYDYDDQFFELNDLWTKFLDGTVTDDYIRETLDGVDVLIDGPVIAFWEEIYRVFPEAKVILTTRDEESWWKSFYNMAEVSKIYRYFCILVLLTPTGRKPMWNGMKIVSLSQGVEGPLAIPIVTMANNPRLYKYKFRQHNSHVLHTVDRERLLVYRSGDGWEPLCGFVDKDMPDEPYPHLNKEGAHMTTEGGPQNAAMAQIKKEVFVILAIIGLLCAVVAYYIFSLLF